MSKRIHDADSMVARALGYAPNTLAGLVAHTSMSRETVRLSLLRLKDSGAVTGTAGVYRLAMVEVAV